MYSLVHEKLDELAALCTRYRVLRLELFGSAVTDDRFDPATSDLDFLVEFCPLDPTEHARSSGHIMIGVSG